MANPSFNDDALQRGERGVKNLGKSDYIRSECSYVIRKRLSI